MDWNKDEIDGIFCPGGIEGDSIIINNGYWIAVNYFMDEANHLFHNGHSIIAEDCSPEYCCQLKEDWNLLYRQRIIMCIEQGPSYLVY